MSFLAGKSVLKCLSVLHVECSFVDPDPVFLGHPDPDPDPVKKEYLVHKLNPVNLLFLLYNIVITYSFGQTNFVSLHLSITKLGKKMA